MIMIPVINYYLVRSCFAKIVQKIRTAKRFGEKCGFMSAYQKLAAVTALSACRW